MIYILFVLYLILFFFYSIRTAWWQWGDITPLREILSLRKRALIIPRIVPRLEQWIRASRMAEKNLVTCLHPDSLTPQSITDWLIPTGVLQIHDFTSV